VLPLLRDWLVDKPDMSRHRPPRHLCGDCGAPWTHQTCSATTREASPPLHGELRRLAPLPELNLAQGDSHGGVLTEGYS